MNRKILIILAIVGVVIVGFGVLVFAFSHDDYVDQSDAEESLIDLGYENATINTCSYEDGVNMLDMTIAKLDGEFTYRGDVHEYSFTYTTKGELFLAHIDGDLISETDHGVCLFDCSLLKEMTSFEYKSDYYDGEDKICHAESGMKYVAIEYMFKNLTCSKVDLSAMDIICITDQNVEYEDSYDTKKYVDVGPSNIADLTEGMEAKFTLLFEIPEDSSVSYTLVDQNFDDFNVSLYKDDTLLPE